MHRSALVAVAAILLPAGDPRTSVRRCVRPQDHDLESALDVDLIRRLIEGIRAL